MRTRLISAVLLSLSSASYAINPVCDATCKPSPSSSTYAPKIALRPKLRHARSASLSQVPKVLSADIEQLPGSQSFTYRLPILSLPGRNGLDVNLALYYNSQVWLIENGKATFNPDRDFPSYGFRLDYGYLEYDSTNNAYVLTESDGAKHNLQNTGTNSYDSVDNTFIHYDSSNKVVFYKDGSRVSYEGFPAFPTQLYRPTRVMDANGNFITINYVTSSGCTGTCPDQNIASITDTLNRTISFSYTNNRLTSISHDGRTWSFGWNISYQLLFSWSGLTVDDSLTSGSVVSVLTDVTFPNGTKTIFNYGHWGMVNQVQQKSATGALRSQTSYNLQDSSTALSDGPTTPRKR